MIFAMITVGLWLVSAIICVIFFAFMTAQSGSFTSMAFFVLHAYIAYVAYTNIKELIKCYEMQK